MWLLRSGLSYAGLREAPTVALIPSRGPIGCRIRPRHARLGLWRSLADRRRPNPSPQLGRRRQSMFEEAKEQSISLLARHPAACSFHRAIGHIMNSLTCAEDAYSNLVERGEEGWIHGLVAFAIFEEQRIEWMRHTQSRLGCLPNNEQIQEWYEQQPISALIGARAISKAMLNRHVQATLKLPDEGSICIKATCVAGLDSRQVRSSGMSHSPVRSALSGILRDPSKRKAAMIAAELALGPRPKR